MKCPKCLKEDYDCECGYVFQQEPDDNPLFGPRDNPLLEVDINDIMRLPDPPEEINIDLDLLQHDDDEVQELDFDEVAFNGDEPHYDEEEIDDDNPRE